MSILIWEVPFISWANECCCGKEPNQMWKCQGVWLVFLFCLHYSWEVEDKLCKEMQFPYCCWQSNFQMQQKSWRPTGIYLINSFSPQRIRLQLQTTLRPDVIYWSRRMVMYKKVTIVDLQNNSLGVFFEWILLSVLRCGPSWKIFIGIRLPKIHEKIWSVDNFLYFVFFHRSSRTRIFVVDIGKTKKWKLGHPFLISAIFFWCCIEIEKIHEIATTKIPFLSIP